MSVIAYRRPIVTDSSGDANPSPIRAAGARLAGIQLALGTLSTPDITITDEPSGAALLTLAGQATDGAWQPGVTLADPADGTALVTEVAPMIFGRVEIVVAGGGDTKTGEITVLVER